MVGKWIGIVLFAVLVAAILSNPANATVILPTGDKYMYPFIDDSPAGGKRDYGSVFGAYGDIDYPEYNFDDRDSQFFLDFQTQALAPVGRGVSNYRIVSLALTLVVLKNDTDLGFNYDPSPDPLSTFLDRSKDADSGRPLELFGVGYRSGWTRANFTEDSPFQSVAGYNRVRNVYALDFDSNGSPRDVSNNVDGGFEPNPWAVADSPGFIDFNDNYVEAPIAPGSLMPEGRVLRFQVDTTKPAVSAYLQESLNAGRLHLMVSSLYGTTEKSSSIPKFYTKDIGLVALSPQLEAEVLLMPKTTIEKISGGFRVSFDTVLGQSYQVQSRDSLTSGSWLPLGTLRAGTGGLLSHDDSTTASSRFYRVSVSKNQQS